MHLQRTLSFILLLPFFISCDSSTETEAPIPYMSLHVGDVRQYFSEKDSVYDTWYIVGETHRTDGQKVFIGTNEFGSLEDTARYFYYFIRDGYFYSTEIDTNSEGWDLPGNPYVEQRLGKTFPKDGDKWIHIDGNKKEQYFTAKYIGSKSTPAKDFKNVYGFQLDSILTVYYAEGFGHIGISFLEKNISILVNYVKVNGKEYGEYIPQDQLPKRTSSTNEAMKTEYGFLGERLD
ncbi:hypothetical protein MNBD_IGNAVI01-1873 [hydrothermal vent metagenome]|uniref:Lipoprotein n=1 Tax=hydrothermal vent metagenome TaxID=652676 RepID=A0A3B1BSK7_9ZZZZ